MPFREMFITLDIVSFLLHLSIMSDFGDSVDVKIEEGAIEHVVSFIGVGLKEAKKYVCP